MPIIDLSVFENTREQGNNFSKYIKYEKQQMQNAHRCTRIRVYRKNCSNCSSCSCSVHPERQVDNFSICIKNEKSSYVKARRMKKSIQETLTTNQRAVLGYLTDHPYASLQETADACELSLGGVKKIVAKLREMTIIERKGAKNNPVWVIH